jgi:hypothetical protein
MLTIAEVPEYIRRAEKLLTADERRELVNYLAVRPKAGVLLEGTGGGESCAGDGRARGRTRLAQRDPARPPRRFSRRWQSAKGNALETLWATDR